jgi:hypothetical protein
MLAKHTGKSSAVLLSWVKLTSVTTFLSIQEHFFARQCLAAKQAKNVIWYLVQFCAWECMYSHLPMASATLLWGSALQLHPPCPQARQQGSELCCHRLLVLLGVAELSAA